MPSLFGRNRRASEVLPPTSSPDDARLRAKRGSVDMPQIDRSAGGPPVSASAEFRSFLGSKGDKGGGEEFKKESLRKRLSSPSTFFSKSSPDTLPTDADLYQDLPPGAATANGSRLASPPLFAESFSLSNTASPESASPRRGSVSWQPSYPTVVDEAYGDIPPDSLSRNGISSPPLPSENAQRRSTELLNTPSPEELSAWPAMEPAARRITPPQTQVPLPTPPPSAISQPRSATSAPRLSLSLGTPGLTGSDFTTASSAVPIKTPVKSADSPLPTPSTPTGLKSTTRPRPDMPKRRTTLIQSPPMPQPIKNLPTLTGWSGFNKEVGGAATPSWGALAKEDGPKTPGGLGGNMPNGQRTPGWGAMMSPGTPRTPGGAGFPFSTAAIVTNKSKEKSAMTEDELRRARRAMVSLKSRPS